MTVLTLTGRELFDRDGSRVGKVSDVLYASDLGEPLFVTVDPGLLRRERIVPFELVEERGDSLVAACTADDISTGPSARDHVLPDGEARQEIFRHYGLPAPVV